MKAFSDKECKVLARENWVAIAAFALAALTFVSATAYAKFSIQTGKQSFHAAEHRSARSDQFTRQYLEDLSFLNANEPVFVRWKEAQWIGHIDEMNWVELLLDISAGVNTQQFQYRLGTVEAIEEFHGKRLSQTVFKQGVIEIEFQAKHGAAVFDFFGEVKARAPSAFNLYELNIARVDTRRSTSQELPRPESLLREGSTSEEQPFDFNGVSVSATLKWFQIELAAR